MVGIIRTFTKAPGPAAILLFFSLQAVDAALILKAGEEEFEDKPRKLELNWTWTNETDSVDIPDLTHWEVSLTTARSPLAPLPDLLTILLSVKHKTDPDPLETGGGAKHEFVYSFSVTEPKGLTSNQKAAKAHTPHEDLYNFAFNRVTLTESTIHLEGTHIPEPGSIAQMAIGLIGVLAYACIRKGRRNGSWRRLSSSR
jgi:hypothetical protein